MTSRRRIVVLLLGLTVAACCCFQPALAARNPNNQNYKYAPIATTTTTTTTAETTSDRTDGKRTISLGKRKNRKKAVGGRVKPVRASTSSASSAIYSTSAASSAAINTATATTSSNSHSRSGKATYTTAAEEIVVEEEITLAEDVEALLELEHEETTSSKAGVETDTEEDGKTEIMQEEVEALLESELSLTSEEAEAEAEETDSDESVESADSDEPVETSDSSSDDEKKRRTGSFLSKLKPTSGMNGIWVRPAATSTTNGGGGGTRRRLNIKRPNSSGTNNNNNNNNNAPNKKNRRHLKGGGTAKLKVSDGTSSKGKKIAKTARAAQKKSPIDCKERVGKKCKQKGGDGKAGEKRGGRITMEQGVTEKEIVPDFSLAEDYFPYEDSDNGGIDSRNGFVGVGGTAEDDAKRFYNPEGNNAGVGGESVPTTEGIPEFIPRAIPSRQGSLQNQHSTRAYEAAEAQGEAGSGSAPTNGFRARASFYDQASQTTTESPATTTTTTAAATEPTAYDEYEAWFNQMDTTGANANGEDAATFYAQDDADTDAGGDGEPVDPASFFDEEDEDGDEEGGDDTEVAADEAVSDFFEGDQVTDETISNFFEEDTDEGDADGDETASDTFFDEDEDDADGDETASDTFFDEDDTEGDETASDTLFDEDDTEGDETASDTFFDEDDAEGDEAASGTFFDEAEAEGDDTASDPFFEEDDEDDTGDDQGEFTDFFAAEDDEEEEDTIPPSSQVQSTTLATDASVADAEDIPEHQVGETVGETIQEEYNLHSETVNGVTFYSHSVSAQPIYLETIGSVDLTSHKEEVFDSLEPLLSRHLENALGDELVEDYQLTLTYVLPEDQVVQLRRGSDAKTYTTQLIVLVVLHVRNEDKNQVAAVTPDVATGSIQSFFDQDNADVTTFLRVLNAEGLFTREIHAQGTPHPPRNHAMDHSISSVTPTDTVHVAQVSRRGFNSIFANDKAKVAVIAALVSALFVILGVTGAICYNRQRREKLLNNGRAIFDAANDYGANAYDSVRAQVKRKRGHNYFKFGRRSTGASMQSNGSSKLSYIQPAAIQLRRNRPKSVQISTKPLAGRQDDVYDKDKKPSSIYDIDIDNEADLVGVRSEDGNDNDNGMASMLEDRNYESEDSGDDDDDRTAFSRQDSVDRISVARNTMAMEERFVDEDHDEEIGGGYSHYSPSIGPRSIRKSGYRTAASDDPMTQKSFIPLSPLSAALAEALADDTPNKHLTHTASRSRTPVPQRHRGMDPEPNVTFSDSYHYNGSAISPPTSMENILPSEYINKQRWQDQAEEDDEDDDDFSASTTPSQGQDTIESSVMTGMTRETNLVLHDNESKRPRSEYRY